MSSRLPAVKERLTGIKSMLAAIKGREGYAAGLQLRLSKVTNIVLENESKVWMRRKVGEQILKDLQDALDTARAKKRADASEFPTVLHARSKSFYRYRDLNDGLRVF